MKSIQQRLLALACIAVLTGAVFIRVGAVSGADKNAAEMGTTATVSKEPETTAAASKEPTVAEPETPSAAPKETPEPENGKTAPAEKKDAETPETGAAAEPVNAAESDYLLLVNPWNALPADFSVELVSLQNGLQVDARIYDDLSAMLSDCWNAGLRPQVCSAYRTQATQTRLYRNKIARLRNAGCSPDTVEAEAARWVAVPGTSEHQTGLALDLISANYPYLNRKQENTAEQQWLMAHCWEYGFILRYPADKTDVTGIGYEPWHYRYVGRETAADMQQLGVCLEEYLALDQSVQQEQTDGEIAEEAGGEIGGELGGEIGGETAGETAGETGGETAGEITGETGGETGGETSGEIGGETDGETGGETGGEIGGETVGETGGETDGETGGETDGETGGETGGDIDGETGGETDGEIDGETAGETVLSEEVTPKY